MARFRDGNTDGDLNDSEDDTLYYLTDANFNVTALADTDGDIVERYEYDAYGKATVLHGADDADGAVTEWDVDSGGSDWDNQILYCGYRFDKTTKLYHVRNRQYHPTLGRWLQRDPAGYGDGINLYQYVMDNPSRYTDPSGHLTVGACRAYWRDKFWAPWVTVWHAWVNNSRLVERYRADIKKAVDNILNEWDWSGDYSQIPEFDDRFDKALELAQKRLGEVYPKFEAAWYFMTRTLKGAVVGRWMFEEGCKCGALRQLTISIKNADHPLTMPAYINFSSPADFIVSLMEALDSPRKSRAIGKAYERLRKVAFTDLGRKLAQGECCLYSKGSGNEMTEYSGFITKTGFRLMYEKQDDHSWFYPPRPAIRYGARYTSEGLRCGRWR